MSQPTQAQETAIREAVAEAFDQQVEFLQRLVSEPSRRTEERAAQEMMAQAFRDAGLSVDQWTLDAAELATHPAAGAVTVDYSNTPVVVGTYEPSAPADGARSLILNGHVDVVPEGREDTWTTSPWDGRIEDGWMYGRGAGDMKAGLVANLFAFKALRAAGLEPTGRVHLQSVPEEECTGNGTVAAMQRGYTADAVLISEPIAETLVRANLGVIWFDVDVTGTAAHAHEMSKGFNALDAAYSLIGDLRELEERWNQITVGDPNFGDLEHPINLNVGVLQAGEWPSSVPDRCTFSVRVSVPPSLGSAAAWQEIEECVERAGRENPVVSRGKVSVSKSGFFSDQYVLEPGTDAEGLLSELHASVTGAPLESYPSPAYVDSRVYGTFQGIPSMVYGPLAETLHGKDERVNLESVKRCTEIYALYIARWCGVREAGQK